MLQERVNNWYLSFYDWFLIMRRIHMMFEDNRELAREENRAEKERKRYEKWYAEHGEEYEAEMERKRKVEEEILMSKKKEKLEKMEREREERRMKEQKRLEKEAMREVESKLKRKKLGSPRLLALRRRKLALREAYDFELYSQGFDRGDTGGVAASHWIRANAA